MEHAVSTPFLLFLLIVSPFLAALCVYRLRSLPVQSLIAAASSIVLAAGGLLLVPRVPFKFCFPSLVATELHRAVNLADFVLLCAILYFGFRHHHFVIKALSVLQIIVLAVLEFFIRNGKNPAETFYGDDLALMLVLVASTATALSVIRLCCIPYMQALESRPALKTSGRHRFFALLLICLGAFNGMLLSNDMSLFYFFFEVITLCSFLLIAQNGAEKKAVRALSMTSLAGLVLLIAMA